MNEEDVTKLISEIDLNNNGTIEWNEFLQMMKTFTKTGKENELTKIVSKSGVSFFKVGETNSSSFSTFSEEERSAFARVINAVLKNDEFCKKYLPIDPESMDLFPALKNGVMFCKLINKAVPDTIDERVINTKENMNVFLMSVNIIVLNKK